MTNKFSRSKYQTYSVPLVGGFLGFLVGISGISNHLLLEQSENIIKTKVVEAPREVTTFGFTGLRTLFLTYVGISAGLAVSNGRNKCQQKN